MYKNSFFNPAKCVLLLCLITVFINTVACQSTRFLQIEPNTNYVLSIPHKGEPYSNGMQLLNINGKECIALFSQSNASIFLFDYKNDSVPFKQIKLIQNLSGSSISEPDANGIRTLAPTITAFYIKNLDSIFYVVEHSNKIYLVDSMGYLKNSPRVEGDLEGEGTDFSIMAYKNDPFFVKDDLVYISKTSYLDKNIYPFKKQLLIYDFNRDSILVNYAEFPNNYKQGKWWHILGYSFSKCMNAKNDIVVSFPTNDSIYVYNSGTLIRSFPGESNYLKGYDFPEHDIDKRTDKGYLVSYVNSIGYYSTIQYDRYRNCYYRLVVHPQNFKNKDGSQNFSENRTWSLQLFDSDFKLKAETMLPKQQYYYGDILITEAGLLISNNNVQNPHYRKNALSFTLFKINND